MGLDITNPGVRRYAERAVGPCYDWWFYVGLKILSEYEGNTFDYGAHEKQLTHTTWHEPLKAKAADVDAIRAFVHPSRWAVLSNIKTYQGHLVGTASARKELAARVKENLDLASTIHLHMPKASVAIKSESN